MVVQELTYFLLGFLASLAGSMVGLGGGFLAVPALYYLGIEMPYAVATAKFMVMVNAGVSSYRYFKHGKLEVSKTLYVAVTAPMIVTAFLGAYLVAVLDPKLLALIVSGVIGAGALKMLISSIRKGKESEGSDTPGAEVPVGVNCFKTFLLYPLIGAISGLVSGVSGLGGGTINMPAFIYVLNLNPHPAVALSMACMFPSALSSVVRHFIDAKILLNVAVPLSLGALLGGYLGPKVSVKLSPELLKIAISLALLLATLRILVSSVAHLIH